MYKVLIIIYKHIYLNHFISTFSFSKFYFPFIIVIFLGFSQGVLSFLPKSPHLDSLYKGYYSLSSAIIEFSLKSNCYFIIFSISLSEI